jgi:3-methylcrotonyl-CoA carboxylase alpha subunit
MSGWQFGGEGQVMSVQRLGPTTSRAASGRGAKIRVTLGEQHRVIELECWREHDGTLVMLHPDGRLERAVVSRDGEHRWVSLDGQTHRGKALKKGKAGGADHQQSLEAPMPGKVTKVLVQVGDVVKKGQVLVTVEAMKMEHALKAPRDGVIESLKVEAGALVSPGTALVVIGDLESAP